MIPVERTSKYIRADAIIDVAISLDLQRPKIVAKEQWDGSRAFILTFGPSGATKTLTINPIWTEDRVREELETAIFVAPKQWTETEVKALKQRKRKANTTQP